MHPAAVQALVCLPLIPAAALLLHHGIAHDERRWRRTILATRIARVRRRYVPKPAPRVVLTVDTKAMAASIERINTAMRDVADQLNGRLNVRAAFSSTSNLSPTKEASR